MAEGAWERLGGERLLETPYFNLRSDRLRLPDGSIKDPYYVVERPDAAIIFPVTGDGEVVLVRQYRPPIDRMELGLPAGLVEGGEKAAKNGRPAKGEPRKQVRPDPGLQEEKAEATRVAETIAGPAPETTVSPAPEMTASASTESTSIQPTPEFYAGQCRGDTYAAGRNMDQAEYDAFANELADRLGDDIESGGSKDMNDILDDMGVPAYEEQCS